MAQQHWVPDSSVSATSSEFPDASLVLAGVAGEGAGATTAAAAAAVASTMTVAMPHPRTSIPDAHGTPRSSSARTHQPRHYHHYHHHHHHHHHHHRRRQLSYYWTLITAVAVAINIVWIPCACLKYTILVSENEPLEPMNVWHLPNFIIDCIFIADLFFGYFTGVCDDVTSEVFFDRRTRLRHISTADLWECDYFAKFCHTFTSSSTLLFSMWHGLIFDTCQILPVTGLIIIGRIMFLYVFVQIATVVRINYGASRKIMGKVTQLEEFMEYRDLPPVQRQRLLTYFSFCFSKLSFRESAVLNFISGNLKEDIQMHRCKEMVANVELFQTLPMHVIVRIVVRLSMEIFMSNEIVVLAGTQGTSMYFISTGTVVVYSSTGREVALDRKSWRLTTLNRANTGSSEPSSPSKGTLATEENLPNTSEIRPLQDIPEGSDIVSVSGNEPEDIKETSLSDKAKRNK